MAGESEAAFVIPVVLFTLTVLSGTIFIFAWLTRRSKDNAKDSSKAHVKDSHPQHGKTKGSAPRPAKKKAVSAHKGNTAAQHKFDHTHLIASLKGHTGQLTGGDFSSNGKHFITSAEVVRACPYVPGVEKNEECKQFKALNHNEDSSCWLPNSLSSSNTPSDTEDSLTSSSSSGSKMSRRQKKNKKRKKINRPNENWNVKDHHDNDDDKPSFHSQKNSTSYVQFRHLGMSEEEVHKLLLPLCINVQERILSGYPYETYRGTYVYKALGFSRLEAVLGDHRLVDAEIEDFDTKNAFDFGEEEYSQNNFMQNACVNDFNGNFKNYYPNFNQNYQKCMRCRQYFDVWGNGETLCFYHPKKAVLSVEGAVRYTCCNMLRTDSGCLVSNYHVFHHLSSGINGPLPGFVSTRPTQRSPRVFGLDCEMVFTSLGFEVARATMVNVRGEPLLDVFIRPEGEIFDYNTEFSGITGHHLINAISFHAAQSMIFQLVKSCDILVGHSLEGDLVVLKILHRRVVDTSLLFKVISNETDSRRGSPLPRRQGLKSLVKEHLGQDIQKEGASGHNSVEDATAALNLVLSQVRGEVSRKDHRRSKIAPLPSVLLAITA